MAVYYYPDKTQKVTAWLSITDQNSGCGQTIPAQAGRAAEGSMVQRLKQL
ncbi:hypothetical protein M2369_003178 [Bacillus sp. JUb11]|uniref:Uncharacterized protein n=1 Tax=Bacillus aerius TaxID=293388 RepID=A0AB39J4P6_9BACI|nr:hypothetical protein [Bacillus sp. JUb11]MCS3485663.1 hypothetical protein [Bacillus sp. JUb11]